MDLEQEIGAFLERYLGFIPDEYLAITGLILTILVLGVLALRYLINPLLVFWVQLRELRGSRSGEDNKENHEPLRPDIRVLRDVWLKEREPNSVLNVGTAFTRSRVISVLNMKGGVGKTTLSANLGAAFSAGGKRVLFVDYDYQGSLSLMVAGAFGGTRRDVGVSSYRTLYPEGAEAPSEIVTMLQGKLEGCGILGASYHLFRDEMEQFAKWSAGDLDYDVRTQFREFVKSDFVQENFDIVLVDCGPRFTTSTINALCGSTHFLVPTILDELSSQAVSYLDKEISAHRDELFSQLRLLGIVPTFVYQDPKSTPTFNSREEEQLESLERTFPGYRKDSPFIKNARIPRRNAFADKADRVVYFESSDARKIFDRAAREIFERLKT